MAASLLVKMLSFIGVFAHASEQCEDGWIQCGHHCLLKVNKKLKWTDAKRYCENEYDADLASLFDSHINTCATKSYEGDNYWISLNDRQQEGSFVWTGRDEQLSLDFDGWSKYQPDNDHNEDCVHVYPNTKWNDYECAKELHFVCSKCKPGLAGIRCKTDINECASNPCQNGNECANSLGDRLDWFECRCIEGHDGRICERDCRPGPSDILFLIDISSSQNETWRSALQFVKKFVDYLPIGDTDFQVAVATYSLDTELLISFDQYHNRSNLSQAIDVLPLPSRHGGPTFTSRALKWAEMALYNNSVGARAKEAFRFRYIFLMTDGLSTDRQDAIDTATYLRSDVRLYVIGIGDQIAHSELFKLASKSDQPYVYSTENQAAVDRFWHDESDKECTDCNATSYVDLLFLMDASVSMSLPQISMIVTSVIHRLVDYLTDSHTDLHVAMASYSDDVKLLFNFTDCFQEVYAQSQRISRDGKEGNTSRALLFSKEVFSEEHGAREDARKLIFLFSNGFWTDPDGVVISAQEIYAANIELSVIVVEPDENDINDDSSNLENVLKILKNPFQMYYVREDLSSVLQVLANTTRIYECIKRDFSK